MAGGCVLLTTGKLGDVLLHIYDFPFEAAIYLPEVGRYEADTPCIVGGGVNEVERGGVARSARISLPALPTGDRPGLLNFPRLHPTTDTPSTLQLRIKQA